MAKTQINRGKKKWRSAPGELLYTGDVSSDKVEISVIEYNVGDSEVRYGDSLTDYEDTEGYRWIDIVGLNNKPFIEEIGKTFDIDDLRLEDIMHMGERTKAEFQEEYFFLLVKNISLDKEKTDIKQEQISFIIKGNTLISFQDSKSGIIDYVKDKFKNQNHNIRKKGIDYLLYYMMDLIVDNYFLILSDIEGTIEDVEGSIISEDKDTNIESVYKIRKELLILRTSIWPLDEIIHRMIRESFPIKEETEGYMRDLKGNLSQIMDYTSIYRESIFGLFDIYLSNTSNKMNKIMQTLTVITVIFIPSTFLTGVYGMNFRVFPELGFQYSYIIFWAINIVLMTAIYKYFKNRKWL